jgi:hypothetical protein
VGLFFCCLPLPQNTDSRKDGYKSFHDQDGDNLDGAVIFPLICRLAVLILGFVHCVKIVGFVQQQQQQNTTTTT